MLDRRPTPFSQLLGRARHSMVQLLRDESLQCCGANFRAVERLRLGRGQFHRSDDFEQRPERIQPGRIGAFRRQFDPVGLRWKRWGRPVLFPQFAHRPPRFPRKIRNNRRHGTNDHIFPLLPTPPSLPPFRIPSRGFPQNPAPGARKCPLTAIFLSRALSSQPGKMRQRASRNTSPRISRASIPE